MKALEALPIWKRLVALPERVDHLERRLAALEARPTAPAPGGRTCNLCNSAASVIAEAPDPTFGVFGHVRLKLRCNNPNCGNEFERKVEP
jgi:hypothetical protein